MLKEKACNWRLFIIIISVIKKPDSRAIIIITNINTEFVIEQARKIKMNPSTCSKNIHTSFIQLRLSQSQKWLRMDVQGFYFIECNLSDVGKITLNGY